MAMHKRGYFRKVPHPSPHPPSVSEIIGVTRSFLLYGNEVMPPSGVYVRMSKSVEKSTAELRCPSHRTGAQLPTPHSADMVAVVGMAVCDGDHLGFVMN